MEIPLTQYPPGDPRLVEVIVGQLKSKGIFDQFRKECLADVDTKPAFQNLRQRVEGHVNKFLEKKTWKNDMNKNQLRDGVRKHVNNLGILDSGIDAIITQVVNPKIKPLILPYVEDTVYAFLQIDKPKREKKTSVCMETENYYSPIQAEEITPDLKYEPEPKPIEEPEPRPKPKPKPKLMPEPEPDPEPIEPEPEPELVEVKDEKKERLLTMETDVISSEEDDILARESPGAASKSSSSSSEVDEEMKSVDEEGQDDFESNTPCQEDTPDGIAENVAQLQLSEDETMSTTPAKQQEQPQQMTLFEDQSLDSISSNSSGLTFSPLTVKGSPDNNKSPDCELKTEDSPRAENRSSTSTPLVDEKPVDENSQSSLVSHDSKEFSGDNNEHGNHPDATASLTLPSSPKSEKNEPSHIMGLEEDSIESKSSSKASVTSVKSESEEKVKQEKSEGEITSSSSEFSDGDSKTKRERLSSEGRQTSDRDSSHKSSKSKSDHKKRRDSHSRDRDREREKDKDSRHHRDKDRKHSSKSRDDHHSHRDKDKKHNHRDKDHDGDKGRERSRGHHHQSSSSSSSHRDSSSSKEKERSSHHSSGKSSEGKSRSSHSSEKSDDKSSGKSHKDDKHHQSSSDRKSKTKSDGKREKRSEERGDKRSDKKSDKKDHSDHKHTRKTADKSSGSKSKSKKDNSIDDGKSNSSIQEWNQTETKVDQNIYETLELKDNIAAQMLGILKDEDGNLMMLTYEDESTTDSMSSENQAVEKMDDALGDDTAYLFADDDDDGSNDFIGFENDFIGFDESSKVDSRIADYLRNYVINYSSNEEEPTPSKSIDDSDLHMTLSEDTWDAKVSLDDFLKCMQRLGAVVKNEKGQVEEIIRSKTVAETVDFKENNNILPIGKKRRNSNSSSVSSSGSSTGSPKHKRSRREGSATSDTSNMMEQDSVIVRGYALLTPEDDGNRSASREYDLDYSQKIPNYSPLSPVSDSSADEAKLKNKGSAGDVGPDKPSVEIEKKKGTSWKNEESKFSV